VNPTTTLREKYRLAVNDETLLMLHRVRDELDITRGRIERMDKMLGAAVETLLAHLPDNTKWELIEKLDDIEIEEEVA
jgi:hypothetical protein